MSASWLTNVFQFAAGGTYNPAPSPIALGSVGPLLCDQYGRLQIVAATPIAGASPGTSWYYSDGALQSGKVVKSSTGNAYQVFGSNESGSKLWVMIFDLASAPGNGVAPKFQIPVSPGAAFDFDFQQRPWLFVNGLYIAASSTSTALTLVAAPAIWLNAEYI